MEDYIYQIRRYLPIKFADDEANEFLQYLEETYLENIHNQKYQFAFKAFHMLYMTFIYKISWFLSIIPTANQMFDYSHLTKGEAEAITNLLKKKGFHVDARNHCSHASGKIDYDEKGVDFLISDELKYIERMQITIKSALKIFFEKFLNDHWSESLIGGDIAILFGESNISRKDLEIIIELKLPLFKKKSDNEKIVFQKILYLVFINEAQKHLELDKNIFIENLPMLMNGLIDEIKIEREEEEEKTISKQEIIEAHLIPIINELNEKDREEAETILNL
jgi:hypothetical protein